MLKKLRELVKNRAKGLCEYCKSPANISTSSYSMEHIHPKCKGGSDSEDNLAYACQGCNNAKHAKTSGKDPVNKEDTPLFNPRQQEWNDNFEWSEDLLEILAKTTTGRVTIKELKLNREELKNLREMLALLGRHPPKE